MPINTAYAQLYYEYCRFAAHMCVCMCACAPIALLIHAYFGTLQEAVQLLLRVMEPSARAGWQARSAAEFFLAGGLTAHPAQLADC